MATERSEGVSRTILPGGLRVVTEFLPAVRSVALGIWVGVGSRDEDETHAGATHYLEHLLFKGTERRTALEISSEMDAVGGEMNAFTGKEYTCYYARVLDADLPLAVDVLSDMVTSSLITPKDVDAERNVVLEEIAMNDDDPSDTVHEPFTAKLFGDTPLGRPILGTADSIKRIAREQIFEHYRARYTPEHLAGAGADHPRPEPVTGGVAGAFGPALGRPADPAPPRLTGDRQHGQAGVGTTLISRGIEQANLVLGCESLARTDERRFALGVLNAAFGGGMSSRLFQEVREKRGLAYSVYSFSGQHADTGMWVHVIDGVTQRQRLGVHGGRAVGGVAQRLQLAGPLQSGVGAGQGRAEIAHLIGPRLHGHCPRHGFEFRIDRAGRRRFGWRGTGHGAVGILPPGSQRRHEQ